MCLTGTVLESTDMQHFSYHRKFCQTAWMWTMAFLAYPLPLCRVSQPWPHCHFEVAPSLLLETALCVMECLEISRASIPFVPRTSLPHRVVSPDIAKCSLGGLNWSQLRTTTLKLPKRWGPVRSALSVLGSEMSSGCWELLKGGDIAGAGQAHFKCSETLELRRISEWHL